MSRLPPFSRGGIVRRPGGRQRRPRGLGQRRRRPGRPPPGCAPRGRAARSISSCDGATPITPAWTHGGHRDAGKLVRARGAPSSSQRTRNGSVKTSARKPKPGMTPLTPKPASRSRASSTSSTSPGSAPSTKTGPGERVAEPEVERARSPRACSSRVSCAVEPVARLELTLVAGRDAGDGLEVRVPAVVRRRSTEILTGAPPTRSAARGPPRSRRPSSGAARRAGGPRRSPPAGPSRRTGVTICAARPP